jgi:hypothetical protein
MFDLIFIFLNSLLVGFRGQTALQAEIIALRHQLTVLRRTQSPKRPILNRADRCFWVWLSRVWPGWRSSLIIVKPETVIGGIAKASVGIGHGRFVTVDRAVLECRRKLVI